MIKFGFRFVFLEIKFRLAQWAVRMLIRRSDRALKRATVCMNVMGQAFNEQRKIMADHGIVTEEAGDGN